MLKIASETSISSERTTSVEQCECPPGYAGLSCELCDFGYRRLNTTLFRGECVPCDCHGHAADCDPYTGQCSVSEGREGRGSGRGPVTETPSLDNAA